MAKREKNPPPPADTDTLLGSGRHVNGDADPGPLLGGWRMSDEPEGEDDAVINDFISQVGAENGHCTIARSRPHLNEHKEAHVGMYPVTQGTTAVMLLEYLRKEFGTGDYHLVFRTGKGVMKKHVRVSVVVDEKPAAPAAAAPSDLGELVKAIHAMAAAPRAKEDGGQMQLMMFMMQMQQQGSKQMADLMAVLIPALVKGGRGDGLGMRDVIDIVDKLRTPATPLKELVDSMQIMKQLAAGENSGPAEEKEDDMFGGLLKAAMPMIGAAVNRMNGAGLPPGQLEGGGGQPAPALPPLFPIVVDKMLKAAAQGKNPGVWAEMALEALDTKQIYDLANVLQQPNWPDYFFNVQTGLSPRRPEFDARRAWFDEWRAEFFTVVSEAEAEAAKAAGTPANAANLPPNPGA